MKLNQIEIEQKVNDFRYKLGDEIKLVREKRGLSQDQLADMMGISRTTISKIENGKFGITVDYLARFSLHLQHEFKVI